MAIEARQVPRGPLGQIWDERVRDWVEEAPDHVQLYLDCRKQYYRKICSKCTHARRVKRKCSLLIPGMTERECRHIKLAFASKYRTAIRRRYESHPFMQPIRWNMELERRRKENDRAGQAGQHGAREARPPALP